MSNERNNPFKSVEVETLTPKIEEISSEEDLKNFYRTRYVNLGFSADHPVVPNLTLEESVDKELSRYHSKSGSAKVFVIRDEGEIVAGGALDIGEFNGQQAAYLSHKFVKKEKRGQSWSSDLVKKRLQVARELGCQIAYSRINKDNFEALRAITKDGFDLASAKNRPGLEFVKNPDLEYFAYRDLAPESQPSQVDLAKVQSSVSHSESGNELSIPLKDKDSIEQAFASGFVGKFVFDAGEISNVKKQVMYLEKNN